MDKESLVDAQNLWKMNFALETFRAVREGIRSVIDRSLDSESPDYYPMTVGIICLYVRPFMVNKPVGQLSEKMVPKEYKNLHADLMKIRNQIFAHSDASTLMPYVKMANELRYRRSGKRIGVFITRFFVEPNFLISMTPLVDKLIEKAQFHTNKHSEKLLKHLPSSQGDFQLNVENPNGPVFIKAVRAHPDVRMR
jgi:hypothetical protein